MGPVIVISIVLGISIGIGVIYAMKANETVTSLCIVLVLVLGCMLLFFVVPREAGRMKAEHVHTQTETVATPYSPSPTLK